MCRRSVVLLVTVLVAALTGCSAADPAPDPAGAPPVPAGTRPPTTAPRTGASAAPGSGPSAPVGAGPAGRAPTKRFAVGVRRLATNRDGNRRLDVTIWYPATGSGSRPRDEAPAAGGRFPVVLFSHGLGGDPRDYQALLTGWAAAGFVVAAPTYPFTSRGSGQVNVLDVLNQPLDAGHVLTKVLELDAAAGDPLRGHLDGDRVAAAGHSAGAITTVGLFTIRRDQRFDAGIVLAGSGLGVGAGFTGPAAPLLFVHGERDEVVPYASGRALFDAAPWPKALLSLPAGGHAVNTGGAAFDVLAAGTLEFLRWSLYGDPAARRRLPGAAGKGGVARLDDRL